MRKKEELRNDNAHKNILIFYIPKSDRLNISASIALDTHKGFC